MKTTKGLFGVLTLTLALVAQVQAQFAFTTNNDTLTITAYTGSGGDVTIPDTTNDLRVTSIANYAFQHYSTITSVTIPDTVTYIGFQAFAYCPNLASIEVGALNEIYTTADGVLFDKPPTTLIQCPSGKTGVYSIPNGVTTIAEWAFAACDNLKSITIPNSVTSIPPHGMYFCHGLTNVTIPNSVSSIGDQAFCNCSSLTSIRIPNGVASIGFDVFSGCSGLTDVTIPDTVTNIGNQTFENCYNLARVTLPNGITSIAAQLFMWCTSLTNITIPESVSSIQPMAFGACTNLAGVFFKGNAPAGADAGYVFVYLKGTPPNVTVVWDPVTVYYLPGTTGWDPWVSPPAAVLWNPQIQTTAASFGVGTNGFGFGITGTANIPMVVEACTDLPNSVWCPLQTCTLTNGSLYFSDPQWTNNPARFYRIRSP
jgi:hypothetical protein